MIFLRFSTEFTRFIKTHVLFENPTFAQAPGTFQYFTDMPPLRTKHLRHNKRNAIGSLGHGGRRYRPKSGGSGGGVGRGRWGEGLGAHQGSICVLGWGRGCAGVGAPWRGRRRAPGAQLRRALGRGRRGGGAARLHQCRETRVRGVGGCGIDCRYGAVAAVCQTRRRRRTHGKGRQRPFL
jgi:hypothetical protein